MPERLVTAGHHKEPGEFLWVSAAKYVPTQKRRLNKMGVMTMIPFFIKPHCSVSSLFPWDHRHADYKVLFQLLPDTKFPDTCSYLNVCLSLGSWNLWNSAMDEEVVAFWRNFPILFTGAVQALLTFNFVPDAPSWTLLGAPYSRNIRAVSHSEHWRQGILLLPCSCFFIEHGFTARVLLHNSMWEGRNWWIICYQNSHHPYWTFPHDVQGQLLKRFFLFRYWVSKTFS